MQIVDPDDKLDTFYGWAVINADLIGKFIAKALVKLTKELGYKQKIHLVGKSRLKPRLWNANTRIKCGYVVFRP